MDPIILAKIITAHNIVYFVLSALVAVAIVNKTKFTNVCMIWIIPVVWICLAVLFAVLGELFKLAVGILIVVGVIVVVGLYLKKKKAA